MPTTTLVEMLCGAAGSRSAVTDPAGTLTYADLCNAGDAVAAALELHGVSAGERVAAAFPDGRAFLVAFSGTVAARAAFVALPPSARDPRALLERVRPRIVLAPPQAPQELRVAAAALAIPVIALALSPAGVALVDGEPVYEAHGRIPDADDVALLAHDGAPLYTHAALVAAVRAARAPAALPESADALAEAPGLIAALAVLAAGGHLQFQGSASAAA